MLQINNLTITHRKDLRIILEDFKLTLNDGDKAVIIGEEGNGKSTLVKWIYDPEEISDYTECRGTRTIGNERLGYLPQELPKEDKEKSLYEFFSNDDVLFDQTPGELALFSKEFHVTQDFFYSEQPMNSLSGGEKIKAQLMRILMKKPTVLLLDEPSNDIDIDTLKLLETMINEWKHIVLFISHDETLIENTANMVVHIEQVQRKTKSRYTVVHMPYRQYIKERMHLFHRQEQQALNDRKEKKIRDEKYMRIYQSVEHAQDVISRQSPGVAAALKRKMHSVKSMEKRYDREDENMTQMPEQEEAIFFKLGDKDSAIPSGKTVIEYELPKIYTPDQSKLLANNIFLRIRGSEKICIVGANGAGKTTLLKMIADELLHRPDLFVQYMPQNYEDLLDMDMTPVDYLDTSGEKEERTRIRTYLGSLKYTADEMEHPIREFPGAVISISHDRKYINEVCDKVYVLSVDGLKEKES